MPPTPFRFSRPTRRDLRLGSGLILFTYVALHLLNHSLGLVSVALAERGLRLAMSVWQSLPGTLLLYGAAAVHVALALESLFARRTLRMAPLDAVRVMLGLGIPTLLIGHAVATRLGWELYQQSADYSHTVWSLWATHGQGLQLALLVPGWLHGCIGLHLAFGRRPLYQRLHRLFFSIALLLPVMGAVGFISMGKELAADVARRAQLDAGIATAPRADGVLGEVARGMLLAYFAAIALVFVAREIRAWLERRSRTLVAIEYPQRTVHVPRGWSVLEASRSHQLAHLSMCGGRARCSTCRVRVTRGAAQCPPPGPAESATLARIQAGPQVRLACQLRPEGDVSVLPLLPVLPSHPLAGALPPAAGQEQELACLAITWRNRAELLRALLPQDAVFISLRLSEAVSNALRATGGAIECDADANASLAVFGLDRAIGPACRGALDAARRAERDLQALAERWQADFGIGAEFVFCADVGPAAVGESTSSGRRTTAGPLIEAVAGLRVAADGQGARIAVSEALLRLAGVSGASPATESAGTPTATATAATWRALESFRDLRPSGADAGPC